MGLGPFLFRAHGLNYAGLTRTVDTPWAELDTAGRLNELQWTGPKSDTIALTGVLFPQAFGGDLALAGLRTAAKAGQPLMLINLGGLIFGRHAITKIEEDQTHHSRTGRARRTGYTMELRRLGNTYALLSLVSLFR